MFFEETATTCQIELSCINRWANQIKSHTRPTNEGVERTESRIMMTRKRAKKDKDKDKDDNEGDDDVVFVSSAKMSTFDRESHDIRVSISQIREIVKEEMEEKARDEAFNKAQEAKQIAQDAIEDARLKQIRDLSNAINEYCKKDDDRMDAFFQNKKIKK